jgi:hypothetical protein
LQSLLLGGEGLAFSGLRRPPLIPAPRIDYTIGENTRRMMEHGIAHATEVLEAAGAKNIFG